jgi:hypothetical protein
MDKIKQKLDEQIFDTMEALSIAYNLGNKSLYKQCLCSLELDLAEYCEKTHEIHDIDKKLIYLYSKLWELR